MEKLYLAVVLIVLSCSTSFGFGFGSGGRGGGGTTIPSCTDSVITRDANGAVTCTQSLVVQSIDGTPIGQTVPAAANFTDLRINNYPVVSANSTVQIHVGLNHETDTTAPNGTIYFEVQP